MSPPPPEHARERSTPPSGTERPLSILVIDDSPGDGRLVVECLRDDDRWHARFACAPNAGAAVEAFREDPPELLILDYNLGLDTAPEVMESLRREGFDGPTVVVTGLGSEDTAARSFRSGAAEYASKWNLTREKLIGRIEGALERDRRRARVLALQQDLHDKSREVERRVKEIGAFYRQIAHELAGPLVSARESVSLALDLGAAMDDEQREFLEIARVSCDRMSRSIDDLLDAARAETDQLRIDAIPCDVRDLVQSTCRCLEPAVTMGGANLTLDLPDDLGEVTVDRDRFLQVVHNLLDNAVKFSPPSSTVVVAARPVGDAVAFSVSDEGPGIRDEHRHDIFERFVQVGARSEGLGLGLYVSRRIVEAHGGRITVDGHSGVGSTFTFTLPR